MRNSINSTAHFIGTVLFISVMCAVQLAQAKDICSDFSGDYQVSGEGPALADVLNVLDSHEGSLTGSKIRFSLSNDVLKAWTSVDGKPFSNDATIVLTKEKKDLRGISFQCKNGKLLIGPIQKVSRNSGVKHLLGKSMVELRYSEDGDLDIISVFSGLTTFNVFSYDSANVDIPIPFTKRTIKDSIQWTNVTRSISMPASTAMEHAMPPDLKSLSDSVGAATVRKWLTRELIGPLTFSGLTPRENGSVVATFTAQKKEDHLAFQVRLQESVAVYAFENTPVWTNGHYWFEVVFTPPL